MRKYTYKPHIVLIKRGKKTRSAKDIDKLMDQGMSYGEAEAAVIKQYIETGKIRG